MYFLYSTPFNRCTAYARQNKPICLITVVIAFFKLTAADA